MKKNLLFLICIMISLNGMLYASSQDLRNVTWIPLDGVFYLTTTDNAILYKIDKTSTDDFYAGVYANHKKNTTRTTIYLDSYKNKRLRKPVQVQVLGYQNNKVQFYYDTYLVMYDDDLYYLPEEFAKTNSELDNINKMLDETLSTLTQKKDSMNSEINNIKATIDSYRRLSEEKLADFSQMRDSLPNVIDSIEQQTVLNYEAYNELGYNKRYNIWYKSLPNSTKKTIKTIKIRNAYLSSPNSAGGCDYKFYYTNKSSKTIKYLTWDGYVYNAVNDMVSCEIRGGSYVSGRDTGPIEFNDEYSGGSWGNVIYNYSADRVELSSIYIQYLDGSSVSIKKTDIKRMLNEPKKESIGWSEKNKIKGNASLQYREELSRCKDSVAYWQKRVSIMQQTSNLSDTRYATMQLDAMPEYKDMYNKLQMLKFKNTALNIELENFRRNNFLDSPFNTIAINQANERRDKYEYDSKLIKRVSLGVGADWLISGDYMGATFPLEVLFGNIDQSFNFSIAGSYTTLGNSSNLSINQLSSIVTIYYNMGKGNHFCFPLSVGVGYNANLGKQTYDITGEYFDDDYNNIEFQYPLKKNKSNFSSIVSIGMRGEHWLFSLYARFDLTPVFDKANIETEIPQGVYIYYDDLVIEDVISASDNIPLFGMSLRYYF